MDWLKNNYERALLIAGAIVLLATSGLVIRNVMAFPEQFQGRNSPKPPDNTIKPYPIEAVEGARARVAKPPKWEGHDSSLLVSRLYILSDGKLIDPLESPEPLHPPITNIWIQKYGLRPEEANLKEQDPDEDRFSNLEEFTHNTDPTDPKSVPPYWTKLRLKKFISKPFRLIFTGTPDEGASFTINTKDAGGRTQFVALGEMIRGTPYKVLSYEKKTTVKNDIEKDVSELTIENTETGQKLILVARQEANDPTSFAEFLYLYDNSTFTVKKDDDFTLKPEEQRKYKLIDISATGAKIQDQGTKEEHPIPPVQ